MYCTFTRVRFSEWRVWELPLAPEISSWITNTALLAGCCMIIHLENIEIYITDNDKNLREESKCRRIIAETLTLLSSRREDGITRWSSRTSSVHSTNLQTIICLHESISETLTWTLQSPWEDPAISTLRSLPGTLWLIGCPFCCPVMKKYDWQSPLSWLDSHETRTFWSETRSKRTFSGADGTENRWSWVSFLMISPNSLWHKTEKEADGDVATVDLDESKARTLTK